MAFKFKREEKELEITGLVDVVFLLLIFFLLTISTGNEVDSSAAQRIDLPHMLGRPVVPNEKLTTLMFRIGSANKNKSDVLPETLFVLLPYKMLDRNDWTLHSDLLTYKDSFDQAIDSSLCYRIPPQEDFSTPSCSLRVAIDRSIERFKRSQPYGRVSYIEISAIENTPFSLINRIMTKCGRENIDMIVFRTIYP